MLLFVYLHVWQCNFFVPTRNITFFFYLTLANPILVYPTSINNYFFLLSTMLINFLCTSHSQNRIFLHTQLYLLVYLWVRQYHFLCTHSQHCILLIYQRLVNPISVYPCVTTPFIFIDNLHLLYTLIDNHHGKYQSEEPQRFSWTNPSKSISGWQTPYCW